MTANEVIAPARPVSGDFSQNPGSDAVEEGNAKIRRSVIAWAVKNPTAVSSFWTAFRPALRQQYGLLKTVRGHAPLYSTPYTRAAFEPLAECLRWYQDVASTREGKETQISEVDQTRCAGIFKKFGVKADFAKVVQDNLSTRNSLWLVQFFARRDADGGEGFVRKIQGMMADYAK